MHIQSVKNIGYPVTATNSFKNKMRNEPVNFSANFSDKNSKFIDSVLKNKFAQKYIFDFAGKSPHVFNLCALAFMNILLRPASILAVPGAKEEDKKYAAAKSIIGSVLLTIGESVICIPIAKRIQKLAIEAKEKPNLSNFPPIDTPKFKAYNYLVNNAVGLALTMIFMSFLTVKLTAKIMHKISSNKKNEQKNSNSTSIISSDLNKNTPLINEQKKECSKS